MTTVVEETSGQVRGVGWGWVSALVQRKSGLEAVRSHMGLLIVPQTFPQDLEVTLASWRLKNLLHGPSALMQIPSLSQMTQR